MRLQPWRGGRFSLLTGVRFTDTGAIPLVNRATKQLDGSSASRFVAPVINSPPDAVNQGNRSMDRRQLLHTVNAFGLAASLPATTFARSDTDYRARCLQPPAAVGRPDFRMAESTWAYPKIGIVAVGEIGGKCLPALDTGQRNQFHLDRTIAVHDCGFELQFMDADRKILVGDIGRPLVPQKIPVFPETNIAHVVAGLDMVLLVAEMGEQTCNAVAPIVARVLRNQGILSLCLAVLPRACEARQNPRIAQVGVRQLRPLVNALMPIDIDRTGSGQSRIGWRAPSLQQLPQSVLDVLRTITNPLGLLGAVNIDFDDLRRTLSNQEGSCGVGFASVPSSSGATAAARQAISHPLLGSGRLLRASAVLVNISAPPQSFNLRDSQHAWRFIRRKLSPDVWITFGTATNNNSKNEITVSILASGIQDL